ncbi:hypothetical protein [Streptomyces sp. URMC 123]|uniref:hypothetical protein n=1 Tax=Streptomyces sp. URMC 123 TaxID=3423403 RepID=UPI003F1CB000
MNEVDPDAPMMAADVGTHCLLGPDGILQVRLTQRLLPPPGPSPRQPAPLIQDREQHRVVLEPRPRAGTHVPASRAQEQRRTWRAAQLHYESLAATADILLARADDAPPLLVLDTLRRRHPALALGIIADEHTVVAWMHTHGQDRVSGYLVTITCSEPRAPVEMFPSALWAWSLWWWEQAQALIDDRRVSFRDLPPPPQHLDLATEGHTYRLELTGPERLSFPARHPQPARPFD